MSRFVQCVKMPIKLSSLWCLQVTSKYLCVFSGGKWTEAEGIYSHMYNERKADVKAYEVTQWN